MEKQFLVTGDERNRIAPAAQRKAVENLSVLVTNGDELGQRGGKLPLATSDLYRVKVAV